MDSISKWVASRIVLLVATIGIVLGIAGGAQAAALITGKQIKNGSVTTVDVKNSTVTADDARNFTITPADYSGDVTGPKGPRGDQGRTGSPGLTVTGYAVSSITDAPKKDVTFAVAYCENGTNAVAGGYRLIDGSVQLLDSAPAGDPRPGDGPAWVVRVNNVTNDPATFVVWAVCAEVQ